VAYTKEVQYIKASYWHGYKLKQFRGYLVIIADLDIEILRYFRYFSRI